MVTQTRVATTRVTHSPVKDTLDTEQIKKFIRDQAWIYDLGQVKVHLIEQPEAKSEYAGLLKFLRSVEYELSEVVCEGLLAGIPYRVRDMLERVYRARVMRFGGRARAGEENVVGTYTLILRNLPVAAEHKADLSAWSLASYAKKYEVKISEYYVDSMPAGYDDYPALAQLLQDAKAGKLETVVITTGKDLLKIRAKRWRMIKRLQDVYGVKVIFIASGEVC